MIGLKGDIVCFYIWGGCRWDKTLSLLFISFYVFFSNIQFLTGKNIHFCGTKTKVPLKDVPILIPGIHECVMSLGSGGG